MELNKKVFYITIIFLLAAGSAFGVNYAQKTGNNEHTLTISQKEYIKEVNDFNSYKKAIDNLPNNNLKYAKQAQELLLSYFKTTPSQELRDKAFAYYRIKFFKILKNPDIVYKSSIISMYEAIGAYNGNSRLDRIKFEINYRIQLAIKESEVDKYFEPYGMDLMFTEGEPYLVEDTKYTVRKFSKFLSSPWQEYLKLRAKESGEFLDDGELTISWDELRKRIIFWEEFINKYPKFPENDEIKAKLADYLNWYICGRYGYYYDGKNNIMKPELKNSYKRFLKENKKSKFYPIINNWYAVLKKNNFEEKDYSFFKYKQPYKFEFYNEDIYDGFSP